MPFNIVLIHPEIPQNTGNIVRTAAATGSVLHLVMPMGFDFSDKQLKRAGLDYWQYSTVRIYQSASDFFEKNKGARFYYLSTKASKNYASVRYKDGDFLVFGSETRGLNERLLSENYDACVRIPMTGQARSLNLSNCVALVLYEALRQSNFEFLEQKGALTGREEQPPF